MSFSPSILLRWINASILMTAGVYRAKLHTLAQSGNAAILMYHRVVSPALIDEYIEPGMYVTPRTFKMHLSILKQLFNVVSLQEVTTLRKRFSKKPRCAITFDDGWFDFYTNAWPLLNAYSLPATIFLPTEYIGTDTWFWTDRLSNILKNLTPSSSKSEIKQMASISLNIRRLSGSLFSRIDRSIKLLKPCSQEQIQETLHQLEQKSNLAAKKQTRAFMNWEECRALKASGLISFGSHTANHIIMPTESEQRCNDELMQSQQKLIGERVVEPTFIPFCYPNGGYSHSVVQMVQKAGYNCAVTTRYGWINKASDPFTLHRVGMHQDMAASRGMMLARITR